MEEKKTLLNQENDQQTLLNAIRNKFATQNANETASFSPPKFTIPTLKMGAASGAETKGQKDTASASALNKFIMEKLNEKHCNGDINVPGLDITNLPKLQLGGETPQTKNGSKNFVIPLLKTANFNTTNVPNDIHQANISNLSKLKMSSDNDDERQAETSSKTTDIDLTAALSSSLKENDTTTHHLAQRFIKTAAAADDNNDFEIPFIECDRVEIIKLQTSALNEYCQIDISDLIVQHSLVAIPSAIGCFLNHDNKSKPHKLPTCAGEPVKLKHKIEPFLFDTKSPDDLVLASLSKYQRQHVN